MSYSVKGAPFRFKGVANVENCLTSADVMKTAGLNWEVAKCEMFANMPARDYGTDYNIDDKEPDSSFLENTVSGPRILKKCPNAYGVYRTDYNIPLGIVKERYEPVQNVDAFKFFDDAIGKDSAIWQTAGGFGNGERVFVSAKLPSNIFVKGDPVENYLVFTNSHDGSSGVKILFTPIRVVCQNTLNAAIASTKNFVSFRHTASVHGNINAAKEILGITKIQTAELNESYNAMAKIKMKDDEVTTLFANIIFTDAELQRIKNTNHTIQQVAKREYYAVNDAELSTNKVNMLTRMLDYYEIGPGQKEFVGTGWGAYNAVTGYYANVDNAIGEKRMDSLLYGDKSRKIEKAGNLILGVA